MDAQLVDELRVVAVDHVARPVLDLEHRERGSRAFAPVIGREERRIELPVEERVGVAQPVRPLHDVALARGAQGEARFPLGAAERRDGWLRAPFVPGGARIGDEIAAPFARAQEALVDELPVGQHDGVARDVERGRELAARGHAGAGDEPALLDRRHDHLADLHLERTLAPREVAEQQRPVDAGGAVDEPGIELLVEGKRKRVLVQAAHPVAPCGSKSDSRMGPVWRIPR